MTHNSDTTTQGQTAVTLNCESRSSAETVQYSTVTPFRIVVRGSEAQAQDQDQNHGQTNSVPATDADVMRPACHVIPRGRHSRGGGLPARLDGSPVSIAHQTFPGECHQGLPSVLAICSCQLSLPAVASCAYCKFNHLPSCFFSCHLPALGFPFLSFPTLTLTPKPETLSLWLLPAASTEHTGQEQDCPAVC